MKKILLVALTALTFASCQQKAESTSTGTDSTAVASETATSSVDSLNQRGAVLNLTTDTYNFGKIKKGEVVSYAFKFKNTGRIPLIIKDAMATCGCTVPEPPKAPIQPGKENEIKVVFNSAGKPVGAVDKVVTVTSNALNTTVQLHMIGEITE